MRLTLIIDGIPPFDKSQLTPDHEVYLTIKAPTVEGRTPDGKPLPQGPVLRFVADVRHVQDRGEIVTATADYDPEAGSKMQIVSRAHRPDPTHDR